MLKVSQLLRGRAKTEPGQLEEAERGLHPGTQEEQEGPAKGEGVGGRKPHARCCHLAYVTFLNIYETKGDQVQMGRNREGSQTKEQTFTRRGCHQLNAAERPRIMWTQRPFDSEIGAY